jgi:hypothetical protein
MTRELKSFNSALLSRLRLLLLCVAALPLLSGCAWLCSFCAAPGETDPSTQPKEIAAVTLNDRTGEVIVFPSTIRYSISRNGPGFVEWRLPANAGLLFPSKDGIRITDKNRGNEEIVRCEAINRGLTYRCFNRATRTGEFKYDITVVPQVGERKGQPVTTDPPIINAL